MNVKKFKRFKNGIVYALELSDGKLIETTDTFLPYYTKDAIGRKQNKLDDENLGDRTERWFKELDELCKFYDEPEHYQYNTFNITQAMCCGETEKYKDIPELVKISEYLKGILDVVMKYNK